MEAQKRYKVLILEDDPNYAEPLRVQIQSDDKFEVLGVTGRAKEAYQLLKAGLPDVVIVDLQLDEGDGLGFLKRIRDPKEKLAITPYVLVTTLFASDTIMVALTNGLADYVLKKQNESYSPQLILEQLHIVSCTFHRSRMPPRQRIESSLDLNMRLHTRVEREINQYTIRQTIDGRKYLIEIIYLALQLPKHEKLRIERLYTAVGKQCSKTGEAVSVAIRRAIEQAFLYTDPETLAELYPPSLNASRGSPENKEFIQVTADKIRKENIT